MKSLTKKSLMIIRYSSYLLVSTLILITSASLKAADEKSVTLLIKPSQCVALHHGQRCYSDVAISFTAVKKSDYCLYSSQDISKPMKCWIEQSQGEMLEEIVTVDNMLFMLRHKDDDMVLAQAELKVAWVYRKNSRAKSAWRIF